MEIGSTMGKKMVVRVSTANRAYVTFLAGKDDYVKGVVGLAKGLRKVKAAYPLVVAVLPDVPAEHRRTLVNQGCIVREIEPVDVVDKDNQFVRPYFGINYCKLRIWKFVEYKKMIYLDSDIQVFDNIDHLFELADGYFYGVVDCLCVLHGQPCKQSIQWPEKLGKKPSTYVNGGMFVLEPSFSTYHNLLKTLEVTPTTPFAEQDFLNFYFKDICKALPPKYNLLLTMLWRHPEGIVLDEVKVVHYCAPGSKPWKYTGKEENMDREVVKKLVKLWWEIYEDQTLDYSNNNNNNSSLMKDGAINEAEIFQGNKPLETPPIQEHHRHIAFPPAA